MGKMTRNSFFEKTNVSVAFTHSLVPNSCLVKEIKYELSVYERSCDEKKPVVKPDVVPLKTCCV
jgi:hypothetical protein